MPWKPEFWSNLPQNLTQPIPHLSDATHKIWIWLAYLLQRYSSLKVLTTDDNGPIVYYKVTLWAFGSGEIKSRSSNLPIIPYMLTKFQPPSSNCFRDILLTRFKCPNFQRDVTLQKIDGIHSKINQVTYSYSSISWPSFSPLAQIRLEKSCWQIWNAHFCKGP